MFLDGVGLGLFLSLMRLARQRFLPLNIYRKTTTMLFKMLGRERAYAMQKDGMAKPRQIFVTQSRVLAGKVEEYFSKLLHSLSTADKTREELAQMIKGKKQHHEDEGLVDVDDDVNWRADLPTRFSELRDEHFPLFLTFDRVGYHFPMI